MKKNIHTRPIPAISPELQHLHPVLARIYASRGIMNTADLEHRLKHLAPAQQLKGLTPALTILTEALQQQKRLLIVGDFDADGATSTTLMVLVLRAIGAKYVDYLVPNRFKFGYGLTPEIVAVALAEKKPDVIITVDNGISSREGVAAAKAAGVQVIITDHHLTGKSLPDADAIINPNQPQCPFPSKNLAGVGVAFYVLASLVSHLKQQGWFDQRPAVNLSDYLDIVALGTVADVVPLDYNNRILVAQGLERIRQGRCRLGLAALLMVGKRELAQVQADDLAFTVAPRLNAAGRLDDMSHGIECLLAESPRLAEQYAHELDGLNVARRDIEAEMQQEALQVMTEFQWQADNVPPALVLYEPHWHQGVIGIVAGRLKDRFHRPSIVFAPADDEGVLLKGSARSIVGLHIRDAIECVASTNPHLISHFGGHAMAAGLTLPKANFPAFQQAFIAQVRAQTTPEQLTASLLTDGELTAEDFNLTLAQALKQGGPWGQAFPEPLFVGVFQCLEYKVLKEKHLRLSLQVKGLRQPLEAIMFHVDWSRWPNKPEQLQLVYRLDVNHFRGESRLQLRVEDWQALS